MQQNGVSSSNAAVDTGTRRCSYCGEPVASFSGYCPACGNELQNKQAVRSAAELAAKLEAIDNGKTFWGGVASSRIS